jgi:drug/metabolite transporter (DMT)-like permease
MPWQLVMVFQNSLAAIFAVNSRYIATNFKRATLPLNLMIYAVIALSGVCYGLLKGVNQISGVQFEHFIGFFILAGLCFAITNILSYVVFQYVDAAVATLLAVCNILASVIFSSIFISEGLTARQLLGALVVLVSMLCIVSIHMTSSKHKRLWIGIGLSISAGVFFGIASTTEKYLLNHVNLPTYLAFGWSFQLAGVIVVSLILGRRIQANYRLLKQVTFWRLALPASFIRMVSGLLFIFSLKLSNNLSIISVFSGLKVLLAALLAAYLLEEREYLRRKYEAALLAIIGIAVMLWQ